MYSLRQTENSVDPSFSGKTINDGSSSADITFVLAIRRTGSHLGTERIRSGSNVRMQDHSCDGTYVSLKRVRKSRHPYEAEVIQFFSTEPLASDPQNHCVQAYEVLQSPIDDDRIILVMPWLRDVDDPRFYTVDSKDLRPKQGVQFMHQHRVAHRDIMDLNIMMDPRPILSEMNNPVIEEKSYDLSRPVKIYTRTKHPVRYYLVDFGLSRKYSEDEMPPLEEPIRGGVKTVPEFQDSVNPCNPFPTDIYYLGFFIRETFVQKGPCFKFLESFVDDMVQEDPAKRPTIDEVVTRFDRIRSSLSNLKLRSRVVHYKDSNVAGFFRFFRHIYRTVGYIATGIPAIPRA
ncbi:hypothetical protein A0H81_09374 [Grifola frondosa]|uniref:Protein kinase domain-containing protein n=1 Tax=Grifola frondosa TaxID=5627 RepID=A0A1C7M156_GRIFR|nr:hypothetical protein A0H81_09374 [Grifola frondosa]